MKRDLSLVATLTLGLLFIIMLVSGISWAQGPEGDSSIPQWTSSAPIPEGAPNQSSPDGYIEVGPAELEIAQSYNADLRITGSVLRPRDSGTGWTAPSPGGCIYATAGSAIEVFNAPVYLPQGATVKYLRIYYYDAVDPSNTRGWFTVYDLYGKIVTEWSVTSSGNSGYGFATTDEFTHTVDYASYSYVVNWRPIVLGSNMQLCGFRIFYHTPPGATYLPLVTKNAE